MKNTGKPSQDRFLDHFRRLGKRAYVYRLVDAAEIMGRTDRIGHARAQPSDYIVTQDGVTFYAEVKSTANNTSFPFSLFKKAQTIAAPQILAAGGVYMVFAHRLSHDEWYSFPFELVQETKDAGGSSIPWSKLQAYLQKDF